MNAKTLFAIFLTLVSWGSSFVFIRVSVQDYAPGSLALFRFFISSCLLGIFYWRLPTKHKPTPKEFTQLFFIGFVGIALYMVLINYGEISVTASIASFIIGMGPVVSLCWAAYFLNEKISAKSWVGIAISVAGLAMIAVSRYEAAKLDWHIILIMVAAMCGGIYNVAQKPFVKKFHPIEITAFATWSATLVLLFFSSALIHDLSHATWHATSSAIYLGLVPSTIGYLAWSYVLSSHFPASKLVLILYALPLVSTLLGWLILHEMPPLFSLLGGLVTLVGAFIAAKR